ncbi:MAG: GPR endopeptidase [Clostridia bacterium]|nr:GPR endopeptidase [Clostridia bacterium]
MRQIWTDLALEAGAAELEPEVRQLEHGIEQTTVSIRDDETAARFGRPAGTYVTLSCLQSLSIDLSTREALSRQLAHALCGMLPKDTERVLVVGLGNRSVTPDALGPRTVDRVLVTRHLGACLPQDVREGMRSVCAAAPGVLGVTGIETAEVIRGMTEHVAPDVVIAVDALAARSSARICSTIQIADTGIAPGSGVGNHRQALNLETLGVPVIAIGVPMVVYAAKIAGDALSAFAEADGASAEDEQRLAQVVERVVSERLGDLIVTPREVDALVERMSGILAEGINLALHPGLSAGDIAQLTAQ